MCCSRVSIMFEFKWSSWRCIVGGDILLVSVKYFLNHIAVSSLQIKIRYWCSSLNWWLLQSSSLFMESRLECIAILVLYKVFRQRVFSYFFLVFHWDWRLGILSICYNLHIMELMWSLESIVVVLLWFDGDHN